MVAGNSARQFAMMLFAFALLLACPSRAFSQCEWYSSTYTDAWVDDDLWLEFVGNVFDYNNCGCIHQGTGGLEITGPEGVLDIGLDGSASVWTELPFNEGLYDYNFNVSIYCWCVYDFVGMHATYSTLLAESPTCGDQRDNIITEYRIYRSSNGLAFIPSCNQFTNSRRSDYYSFSDLNTGDYSAWALIKKPLIVPSSAGYGLDLWRETYGQHRDINSAYRNPERNFSPPVGGANNSRHMYGDAVDMDVVTNSDPEWQAIYDAVVSQASWMEPDDGPCHKNCVHADWRNRDAGQYK